MIEQLDVKEYNIHIVQNAINLKRNQHVQKPEENAIMKFKNLSIC